MRQRELDFFATPAEQKNWLAQFLGDTDVWCVLWTAVDGPRYVELDVQMVDELSFSAESEDEMTFFLGRKSLVASPIWNTVGAGRRELDFLKSSAVQYVPALVVHEKILLEGRMAILPSSAYEDAGVDPKPIAAWFKKVRDSFASMLREPRATLVQSTTSGAMKSWNQVLVSPGAVAAKTSGKLLKQFPEGEVEFDVRLET